MKILRLVLVFLILTFQFCCAQNKKVPKNLGQAVKFLQANCTDSLKTLIKNTNDNKLADISYPWGGKYKTIYNWLNDENKDVKIDKYLKDNGVSYNPHQEEIILLAFKLQLLGKPVNEKQILKPYQVIESKWSEEDKVRFTTDSLRGIYIPKDLEDCFKQIDKFWADSTKSKVKSWTDDEFFGKTYRFGIGLWMRNNWQLWGGSRLTAYFNKLGVNDPESMSAIILISYHRHLLGVDIKLQDQVNNDKKNWAKIKLDDSLSKIKDFKEYSIGDTVTYNYKLDFVSKEQEEKSDKDICHAKGIIIGKDETKLFLKVMIIETCDTKGIIVYDSKNSFVFDQDQKKWVRLKKRTIIRAHKNDVKWFNYDYWEPKDN